LNNLDTFPPPRVLYAPPVVRKKRQAKGVNSDRVSIILNRLPENWKKTVSYPDCYTHRDAANKFVSIMNEMGWGSLLDC